MATESSRRKNCFVIIITLAVYSATTTALVLPRPPATNLLVREHPVTSSDLPKQIPPPPQPGFTSTPNYEQQLPRLLWVTNTPYPVYQQWK